MIPLTTKLPAICSLLQRVLEMETKATPGPWKIRDQNGLHIVSESKGICTAWSMDKEPNAALIALSRNITKPQATALLLAIEGLELIRDMNLTSTCLKAARSLQSIADAFPDALFQDSSRCA